MSAIHTGRDPFARHTIRKRKVYSDRSDCTWCGGFRDNRHGDRYLWQYYVDADSARESGDIHGTFCSLSCCNSYHS